VTVCVVAGRVGGKKKKSHEAEKKTKIRVAVECCHALLQQKEKNEVVSINKYSTTCIIYVRR
jgi:hypothetical protein